MRVAIHQPHYLPWPGYLAKVAACDVFVVNDVVQFCRRDWQNRNRVSGAEQPRWLTVPVHLPNGHRTALCDVQVESGWSQRHHGFLRSSYARAPYYPSLRRELGDLYDSLAVCRTLCEVATLTLSWHMSALGLSRPKVVAASGIMSPADWPDDANEGVIGLVRAVGGTEYLSGSGARAYHDDEQWAKAGIPVVWGTFHQEPYAQVPGRPFEPALCVLDAMLWVGPDRAIQDAIRGFTVTGG